MMPTGVSKSGGRLTPKRIAEGWTRETIHLFNWHTQRFPPNSPMDIAHKSQQGLHITPEFVDAQQEPIEPTKPETDEEIDQRLNKRFGVLDAIVRSVVQGTSRAIIVGGAPGVGKSHTVESVLSENLAPEEYTFNKGYVKATGLFKLAYQHRLPNQVLIFDDADSIFADDVSLNILKALCDTTEKRHVSWASEAVLLDEETGMPIPKKFEFEGKIVFITNLDFDRLIAKGHKLSPHLAALQSRAHHIELGLSSLRDRLIRIRQVAKVGLFKPKSLTKQEEEDVLQFLEKNLPKLREVSLRMALKVADLRKSEKNWEDIANVTCLKNKD
jgi:hypothetical protein